MSKCNNCIHRYVCELKCAYEDNDRECLDFDEERPQGEWLHNGINVEGMDLYRCSICNRSIVTWSSRIDEYPYCHCGADMQKGGVE
jgi:hypothetical protein